LEVVYGCGGTRSSCSEEGTASVRTGLGDRYWTVVTVTHWGLLSANPYWVRTVHVAARVESLFPTTRSVAALSAYNKVTEYFWSFDP